MNERDWLDMDADTEVEVVARDVREREWRSWSIVDSRRRRSRSVADGRIGRGSILEWSSESCQALMISFLLRKSVFEFGAI